MPCAVCAHARGWQRRLRQHSSASAAQHSTENTNTSANRCREENLSSTREIVLHLHPLLCFARPGREEESTQVNSNLHTFPFSLGLGHLFFLLDLPLPPT
eukprot:scaffold2028_cov181-Ochromonas_danica.AAC.29